MCICCSSVGIGIGKKCGLVYPCFHLTLFWSVGWSDTHMKQNTVFLEENNSFGRPCRTRMGLMVALAVFTS